MVGEDEHKINGSGGRMLTCFLSIPIGLTSSILLVNMDEWLTLFSNISSGVEGGTVFNSEGRRAALRQFLIRGASWAFPSVFCNEGTGWYVLSAVFISGKTVEIRERLFFLGRRKAHRPLWY
jgi:hypothetical protein